MDNYQNEDSEKLEVGILKSKDLGRDQYGDNYRFQSYFGNPFFTLSMTNRKTMDFYDCKNLSIPRCVKSVEEFNSAVNHIIPWSDTLFLACSDDTKIRSFSIRNFRVQKMFLSNRSPVLKLLKLDSNRFMSVNSEGRLFIFNYYTRRMEKELTRQKVGENVNLVRSKMMENCFFINTQVEGDGNNEVIKLINYETDQVVKEFILPSNSDGKRVFALDTYVTFHEILISMNEDSTIDFFNCDHKVLESPSLSSKDRRLLMKEIRLSSPITSHCLLKNRYLCIGDKSGLVHLISLEESTSTFFNKEEEEEVRDDFKKDDVIMKKDDSFLDVLQTPVSNGRVDSLVVLSCTPKSTKIAALSKENRENRRRNTWISILEMKNLWLFQNGEKKMAQQDLMERSQFVRHDIISSFFPQEEEEESDVKSKGYYDSLMVNFRFLQNNKTIKNVLKTFIMI